MGDILMLLRSWRGGSRHMVLEDYLAAFCLPLLVILIARKEALLFETPASLMSLLCVSYTLYLIHTKSRWPRGPSSTPVLALIAGTLAVCVTFVPGPRINAWLGALAGVTSLGVYRALLELVWREFRAAFTPGEVLLLAQAATMVFFSTLMELLKCTNILKYHEAFFSPDDTTVTTIIRTGVVCAVFVFYACLQERTAFSQYLTAAILYGACHVTLTMVHVTRNPITWSLQFISQDGRAYLFLYWFALLLACLPILFYHRVTSSPPDVTSSSRDVTSEPAGTVSRKSFHALIVAVFVPGLWKDVPLLALAAGVALAVLIVLETTRLHGVPPLGPLVESLFSSFRDRQDRGALLMTPLYLLIACAGPVWLGAGRVRKDEVSPLPLWLGVMSVGVGDAAAAIVGSKLYKYSPQLSDGKSLAGFVACLVSQLLFWLVLWNLGVEGEHCVMPVVILLSSLAESYSSHVDNLVMPLYTLLAYTLLEILVQTVRAGPCS